MINLILLVDRLPVPKSIRLSWQRVLIQNAYIRDIKAARMAGDNKKIDELEQNQRLEIDMIIEQEEYLYSQRLLRQARRLRVPIPAFYTPDSKPTDDWIETQYLGMWRLTELGIAKLREEIRKEQRWRFERRAHWVAWISAITGVIGALTGLLAVWLHN